MYSGLLFFAAGCGGFVWPLTPTTNSAEQPSATQTTLSSFAHVLPSSHSTAPSDRCIATPADVSAAQCCRSPPSCDEHVTVGACASKDCGSVKKRMAHRAAICTAALLVIRFPSFHVRRSSHQRHPQHSMWMTLNGQLVFGAVSTEYGFP